MIQAEYNNRRDRAIITGFMPSPVMTVKLPAEVLSQVIVVINNLQYNTVELIEHFRVAGIAWKEL